MKTIKQYFHVALFVMLYKVVLTLKSLDKTLVWYDSNEICWAVFSLYVVSASNFKFWLDETQQRDLIRIKAIERYYWVVLNLLFVTILCRSERASVELASQEPQIIEWNP